MKGRLAWVDTARGVAIVLVALFHSVNWLLDAGLPIAIWDDINEVLSSIRMPLFFAVSGLFAMKWITGEWSAVLRTKVLLFAWVYAVWQVIGSVVMYAGMGLNGDRTSIAHAIRQLLESPVLPRFELWFIWALGLFFVLAKATRRVDVRLQLGVALVASVVALTIIDFPNVGWGGVLKYYVFFLAGLYGRHLLLRFGDVRSIGLQIAIVAGWLAYGTVLVAFDLRHVPGLYFLNCAWGLFAGICIGRGLSRVTLLGFLGSRTLPLYLGHTPVIVLIALLLAASGIVDDIPVAVAMVAPVVVAALGLAAAWGLYVTVGRRLPWLYEPAPLPFLTVAPRE